MGQRVKQDALVRANKQEENNIYSFLIEISKPNKSWKRLCFAQTLKIYARLSFTYLLALYIVNLYNGFEVSV